MNPVLLCFDFNSVAQASGVARSYLYANQDIRIRIETLRKQQEGVSPKQVKREMTDKEQRRSFDREEQEDSRTGG